MFLVFGLCRNDVVCFCAGLYFNSVSKHDVRSPAQNCVVMRLCGASPDMRVCQNQGTFLGIPIIRTIVY